MKRVIAIFAVMFSIMLCFTPVYAVADDTQTSSQNADEVVLSVEEGPDDVIFGKTYYIKTGIVLGVCGLVYVAAVIKSRNK